jgi:sialate O-acetylesterase
MKRIFPLLLISTLLLSSPAFAEIELPAVFSDNMVLQQKSEVAIWGWGLPSEMVKIVGSWNSNDTVLATVQNDASWKATLKTGEAGGPYTLSVLGSTKVTLENVMLGEVWICSGQSNMELNITQKIIDGEEEAAKASFPGIRIFHIPKIGHDYPQRNCNANWVECSPTTVRSASAVAYFYGRELHQKLDVPVGLILCAWGGTPAEVWLKKEEVEDDPELKKASGVLQKCAWWPYSPGVVFNGMIAPVVPYTLAGAIWYQGESNVENYWTYNKLFRKLIGSWREEFKSQFPFYYVQIAPFTYGPEKKGFLLREQQVKAMETPNTGMVVISDLVKNVNDIHPRNKKDVGKRLANWALAETYGMSGIAYKSPIYKSMEIKKGKIRIDFHNAENGLACPDKIITQFMIAGEDKQFVDAEAKIKGNSMIVHNKEIKKPVAVRFSFDNASIPNLFNTEGLPVSLFRTDDWKIE